MLKKATLGNDAVLSIGVLYWTRPKLTGVLDEENHPYEMVNRFIRSSQKVATRCYMPGSEGDGRLIQSQASSSVLNGPSSFPSG